MAEGRRALLKDLAQVAVVFTSLLSGLHWLFPRTADAPDSSTGAPNESTCMSCHTAPAQNVTSSSDLSLAFSPSVSSGYSAGTQYDLTFSIVDGVVGNNGFEVTVQKTSNDGYVDGLSNPGSGSGINSARWWGHRNATTTTSWTAKWTAPSSGTGQVRFYSIVNKGGGGSGGNFFRQTFTVAEAASPSITTLSPGFGSVNSTTTLTGTNFGASASSVSFSGTLAECPSWAATSITCRVPSVASGAKTVTVQTSAGTSGGAAFTVTSTPTVSGISPNFGSATDTARTASLTGNQFSSGATVQLILSGQSNVLAAGFSVAAITSITGAVFNLSGKATGQWTVEVVNPDASSGTLAGGFTVQVLPAQATGLAGTVLSSTSIRWDWTDAADNEDGYRVQAATFGVSGDLAAGVQTYTESGLTPNLSVSRLVQAFNVIGTSDSGAAAARTNAAVPASLATPSVQVSSVSFTWEENNNPGGTTYEAQISTDAFASVNITSSIVTASTVFGAGGAGDPLLPNTTYELRVRAVNGSGVLTDYAATGPIRTLPSAPGTGSPALAAVETGSITFQWTAGTNPDPSGLSYEAQISTDAFASVNHTSTTANLSVLFGTGGAGAALLPNTTYHLRARAKNATGDGAFGAAVSTLTPAAIPISLATPSVQVSSVNFTWGENNNPGGTTYEAQISTDAFASVNDTSSTLNASVVFGTGGAGDGLPANTTYELRVRAVNQNGTATAYASIGPVRTLPSAPGAGAPPLTPVGTTSIIFQWTSGTNPNPSGLTYEAQISTDAFASVNFTSTTPNLSVPFGTGGAGAALTPSTTYHFRARAKNASGDGAFAATASLSTLAEAPSSLAVTGRTSFSASLSFSRGANGPATLYEISASTDSFSANFSTPVPFSAGLTDGATTVVGLAIDTLYSFRVRARNANEALTLFSNPASTQTLGFPNPPTGASGTAVSTGSIRWTWTDASSDEAGFRVYRSSGAQVSSDLAAGTTEFLEAGLLANTSYQAYAVSFGPGGAESPGSTATARFTLADPPSGLGALAVDGSSVSLKVSWSTANASGHELERSLSESSGFAVTASSSVLGASATTFLDAGLSALTTYFYRVRGLNGDGTPTSYASTASARTNPPLPSAPVLTGVALSTESIRWTWTVPSDVTGFDLKTSTGGAVALGLGAGTSSYTEAGLSPGTTYARLIEAKNATGGAASAASVVATASESQAVSNSVSSSFAVSGTTLSVPAGALGGDGTVSGTDDPAAKPLIPGTTETLSNANAALGSAKLIGGTLRQLLAFVGGTRKTDDFAQAVRVTLAYPDDDSDGVVDQTSVKPDQLSVHTLSEGGGAWSPLTGTSLDRTQKTVSGLATHFSLFALIGAAPAADLSKVRVFPNPFQPSKGHAKVRLRRLPASASVRVYTASGERVRSLAADASGDADWDGRNDAGHSVASGVYVVVVESGGEKRRLRVGVER